MMPTAKLAFRSCNYVSWAYSSILANRSKVLWPCILKSSFSMKQNPFSEDVRSSEREPPVRKTSKAMRAYMERTRKHEEFMRKEKIEFEIGKRHLANMMGEDPELFTQEDVDRAIEYLFPSGLFETRARPFMKPPEEVHPPYKAAEFDESGRPYHFLFYTGKSNFYKLLYDIVENINNLNIYEDKMIRKHLTPDPTQAIVLSGSEWLPQELLERRLVETLNPNMYAAFNAAFDRLASHPYAYHVRDFIFEYRKSLVSQTSILEKVEFSVDEDGREYITVTNCLRKRAWAQVTVYNSGSGKISINGRGIDYFSEIQSREQILFPLIFTNKLLTVDVKAVVKRGGPSGQAGAIRWGISHCLRSFVDDEMVEKMRLAGLLTRDYRKPERKKPGQPGRRKKYTWRKR